MFWNRAYINLGKDFYFDSNRVDFEALIDTVAVHKKEYAGIPLAEIEADRTVRVFRGRTKRFIVQEVNKFISNLQEVQSINDNMASFTSKRQINRLIEVFRGGNKRVTAYAFIITYVMAVIILENPTGSTTDFSQMEEAICCICAWMQAYSAVYPEDELATFLLDCYKTVWNALQARNTQVTAQDFPYIPKKNPADPAED